MQLPIFVPPSRKNLHQLSTTKRSVKCIGSFPHPSLVIFPSATVSAHTRSTRRAVEFWCRCFTAVSVARDVAALKVDIPRSCTRVYRPWISLSEFQPWKIPVAFILTELNFEEFCRKGQSKAITELSYMTAHKWSEKTTATSNLCMWPCRSLRLARKYEHRCPVLTRSVFFVQSLMSDASSRIARRSYRMLATLAMPMARRTMMPNSARAINVVG